MAHSGLTECAIFVAYHMSKITKTYTVERKGDWVVASTPAVDRDKDRVMPQGINTDNFQKNPALFYGHNYSEPWAVIGKVAEWKIDGESMVFRPELREPANEADPMTIVKLLWDSGLLNASSIGFIPRKGTKNEYGGMDFTDVELLEISLTPLPANQTALRLAMKGLNMGKQITIKSPDYRLPDETVEACNARKFQELMDADPSLSEADARAEAARICSQDAPPADKPADAPADTPPPDQPAKDAGGDMAQYMQELGAHLAEAVSLFNELMGMMQPAPQDAPADQPPSDQPAQNSVSPEAVARSVVRRLRELDAPKVFIPADGKQHITKRGRVLSAGNESKLRTAHSNIGEVLAQLGEDAPEQTSAGKSADEAELKFLKELAASLGDLPKVFSK